MLSGLTVTLTWCFLLFPFSDALPVVSSIPGISFYFILFEGLKTEGVIVVQTVKPREADLGFEILDWMLLKSAYSKQSVCCTVCQISKELRNVPSCQRTSGVNISGIKAAFFLPRCSHDSNVQHLQQVYLALDQTSHGTIWGIFPCLVMKTQTEAS